ncbi:PREDICTED: uncharacterized protein LOC105453776 [Wasmannia auropunctata]|uniref:uncharacterized protein LOC105453776 n=1 Tax=Wasmannia auropunctata TaxID=64793 RepID=UPI0005F0A862|nr:PREDICTED: uncharacterized protein LOC105453776 [Wasmannia auropunctata]
MLPKNFQVCCQILTNIARNSLPIHHFSKKVSRNGRFIEWPEPLENKIRLTRKQYQKRLEQCPKPSFAQLCCKKLFSKSNNKPECKAITIGDDYIKARQCLKLRVEDLIKFVEDETQLIANDVKSRLDSNRATRATQLEYLLTKTTGKLDEVMKLNGAYGIWMRKKTLLLNDEIKRSFDAVERAIGPNEKRIASMLAKLRSDVSDSVESAEKNLVACRKHDLPLDLARCTKERSDEATRMLDRMNEEACRKLKEIAKFRETVLRTHEITTQETIEINRKKTTDLLRLMKKCIVQLKKSKMRRKKRGTKK